MWRSSLSNASGGSSPAQRSKPCGISSACRLPATTRPLTPLSTTQLRSRKIRCWSSGCAACGKLGSVAVLPSGWALTCQSICDPSARPEDGGEILSNGSNREVPITTDHEPSLPLEKVPGSTIAGPQHRPAHADQVRGVVRQTEAVKVLPGVLLLVSHELRVLRELLLPRRPGGDDVSDRECAGHRKLQPIALTQEQ